MKLDIKAELLREISSDIGQSYPDAGIRTGGDPFRPTYRGRVVVSFACWDPLGVSNSPEVIAAYVKGAREHGTSAVVARGAGGVNTALLHVEDRVARFFGAECSTIFSTRNQCVLTAITTLCGDGVVVVGSPRSSLPLADACALSGGEFVEADGEIDIRRMIQKRAPAQRLLVVIESASIISGEIADLPNLLTAIEHVGGWALIDETGACGWLGLRGAGSADVTIGSPGIVGRISGFQGIGGGEISALVGSMELRELVLQRSRYVRQEPSPSGASLRALSAALDMVEVSLLQREKLLIRAKLVGQAVRKQGWKVLSSEESPILSIFFESTQKARVVQDAMLQRGIVVEVLPARGIRKNGAIIRAILSNGHTQEEVEKLLSDLEEVRKRTEAPLL